MIINCDVYRCSKKAETYLYLKTSMAPEDLPDGLKALLGDLTQFLNLELGESSQLAQAEPRDVLTALKDQGFYLQMPPGDRLSSSAPGSNYIQ